MEVIFLENFKLKGLVIDRVCFNIECSLKHFVNDILSYYVTVSAKKKL